MSALAGTGSLLRLALRRDRILAPAWIAVFVLMVTYAAAASIELYPTLHSRVTAAQGVNGTAALVALYGRVYEPTIGAISIMKMGGIGGALIAVLAFMLVVRHTRAEEESGRLELVSATVVGRTAPLTAAVLTAVGTTLAIGSLAAAGLTSTGLPARGSVAFGLAWAATGLAFTAVGALAAQLTTGGRAAVGLSAAFLGLAYLLRAAGDTTGTDQAGWLSWLSPIGWSQQVRPYAHERWGVLLLLLVFAVVVGAAAYAIAARRDLGAGMWADRPGAATAAPYLSSTLGLAWRLERGALLAWGAGYVLLAAVVGSVATDIGGFLESPQARDFIAKLGGTKALTDAFLATEFGMVGVITAVYAVQVSLRLRSEETSQRTELILATSTHRPTWVASHLTMAVAGSVVLLMIAGLVSGIAYASQTGDAADIERVFAAALVQLPAVLVMIGSVVALWGVAPGAAAGAWALLVAFLLIGEFGPLFELPRWAIDLSPFGHTPKLPGQDLRIVPLVVMTLIGVALMAFGIAAFRRRDVGRV
jgi:ABC-2 type transport system permease protein